VGTCGSTPVVHPFHPTSTRRFLLLQRLLLLSSQLYKPKDLTRLASPLLETTWEETLRPLLEDDVCIMTVAQAEGVRVDERCPGSGELQGLGIAASHARRYVWSLSCV
jgi:hypothetical protein